MSQRVGERVRLRVLQLEREQAQREQLQVRRLQKITSAYAYSQKLRRKNNISIRFKPFRILTGLLPGDLRLAGDFFTAGAFFSFFSSFLGVFFGFAGEARFLGDVGAESSAGPAFFLFPKVRLAAA